MSGACIQALERKPWEKHLQTNAKSTFLVQNALPSPTMVSSSPPDDGSGLPRAASGGNISPERSVIRWMSAQSGPSPGYRLEAVSGVPTYGMAGDRRRRALEARPYVIRVKVPSGVKLMPHKHREDYVYTVIS